MESELKSQKEDQSRSLLSADENSNMSPYPVSSQKPSKNEQESIRVVVRVRPLNKKEIDAGEESVTSIEKDRNEIALPGTTSPFAFDSVFGGDTSQESVFNSCAVDVIDGCLKGYNGTIFAYGQTGSGKTWTMQGIPDQPGLIPRTFSHVFDALSAVHKSNPMETLMVRCSFLEVYNETVHDLLAPKGGNKFEDSTGGLAVKEDAKEGRFFVKGLTDKVVGTPDEMTVLVDEGLKRRAVGHTAMNSESSRSHALFTVVVERDGALQTSSSSLSTKKQKQTFTAGKLNLVDLAGSERSAKTGLTGAAAKEGSFINKSLSSLGDVIKALEAKSRIEAEAAKKGVKPKQVHVPYRDSVLTKLLAGSLGGNARTLMVANCGPAASNALETLSTLRFASRVKKVKNKPVVVVDPKDAKLKQMAEEIEQLKEQIRSQQEAFQEMEQKAQFHAANAQALAPLSPKQLSTKPGAEEAFPSSPSLPDNKASEAGGTAEGEGVGVGGEGGPENEFKIMPRKSELLHRFSKRQKEAAAAGEEEDGEEDDGANYEGGGETKDDGDKDEQGFQATTTTTRPRVDSVFVPEEEGEEGGDQVEGGGASAATGTPSKKDETVQGGFVSMEMFESANTQLDLARQDFEAKLKLLEDRKRQEVESLLSEALAAKEAQRRAEAAAEAEVQQLKASVKAAMKKLAAAEAEADADALTAANDARTDGTKKRGGGLGAEEEEDEAALAARAEHKQSLETAENELKKLQQALKEKQTLLEQEKQRRMSAQARQLLSNAQWGGLRALYLLLHSWRHVPTYEEDVSPLLRWMLNRLARVWEILRLGMEVVANDYIPACLRSLGQIVSVVGDKVTSATYTTRRLAKGRASQAAVANLAVRITNMEQRMKKIDQHHEDDQNTLQEQTAVIAACDAEGESIAAEQASFEARTDEEQKTLDAQLDEKEKLVGEAEEREDDAASALKEWAVSRRVMNDRHKHSSTVRANRDKVKACRQEVESATEALAAANTKHKEETERLNAEVAAQQQKHEEAEASRDKAVAAEASASIVNAEKEKKLVEKERAAAAKRSEAAAASLKSAEKKLAESMSRDPLQRRSSDRLSFSFLGPSGEATAPESSGANAQQLADKEQEGEDAEDAEEAIQLEAQELAEMDAQKVQLDEEMAAAKVSRREANGKVAEVRQSIAALKNERAELAQRQEKNSRAREAAQARYALAAKRIEAETIEKAEAEKLVLDSKKRQATLGHQAAVDQAAMKRNTIQVMILKYEKKLKHSEKMCSDLECEIEDYDLSVPSDADLVAVKEEVAEVAVELREKVKETKKKRNQLRGAIWLATDSSLARRFASKSATASATLVETGMGAKRTEANGGPGADFWKRLERNSFEREERLNQDRERKEALRESRHSHAQAKRMLQDVQGRKSHVEHTRVRQRRHRAVLAASLDRHEADKVSAEGQLEAFKLKMVATAVQQKQKAPQGLGASELFSAGFTALELFKAGFTVAELKEAGFSDRCFEINPEDGSEMVVDPDAKTADEADDFFSMPTSLTKYENQLGDSVRSPSSGGEEDTPLALNTAPSFGAMLAAQQSSSSPGHENEEEEEEGKEDATALEEEKKEEAAPKASKGKPAPPPSAMPPPSGEDENTNSVKPGGETGDASSEPAASALAMASPSSAAKAARGRSSTPRSTALTSEGDVANTANNKPPPRLRGTSLDGPAAPATTTADAAGGGGGGGGSGGSESPASPKLRPLKKRASSSSAAKTVKSPQRPSPSSPSSSSSAAAQRSVRPNVTRRPSSSSSSPVGSKKSSTPSSASGRTTPLSSSAGRSLSESRKKSGSSGRGSSVDSSSASKKKPPPAGQKRSSSFARSSEIATPTAQQAVLKPSSNTAYASKKPKPVRDEDRFVEADDDGQTKTATTAPPPESVSNAKGVAEVTATDNSSPKADNDGATQSATTTAGNLSAPLQSVEKNTSGEEEKSSENSIKESGDDGNDVPLTSMSHLDDKDKDVERTDSNQEPGKGAHEESGQIPKGDIAEDSSH